MLCTAIGLPAPIVTEPTRTTRVGFRTIAGVVFMAASLTDEQAKAKFPPDPILEALRAGERQRVLPASSALRPEYRTYGRSNADTRPQDLPERWRRRLLRPPGHPRTRPHRFPRVHRSNKPVHHTWPRFPQVACYSSCFDCLRRAPIRPRPAPPLMLLGGFEWHSRYLPS